MVEIFLVLLLLVAVVERKGEEREMLGVLGDGRERLRVERRGGRMVLFSS